MVLRCVVGLLSAGLGLSVTLSPQIAKKPSKTLAAPKVRITRAEEKSSGRYATIECEVSNRNAAPLPFLGYMGTSQDKKRKKTVISPIYRIQFQRDGKWAEYKLGWCGTGLGPVAVPAKKDAVFQVAVPIKASSAGGAWDAVRIGIRYDNKPGRSKGGWKVAWSKPLSRDQLADGKP